MDNPKTCECKICRRTNEYARFSKLLPESARESFREWYSSIFDELEELETDREFQEWLKQAHREVVDS